MKNKLLLLLMISATFFFSGCGKMPEVEYKHQDTGSGLAKITIKNGAGTPSWSMNERDAAEDALQVAAEATLQKGFKYFAIIYPENISNIHGNMSNTAKDYLKMCDPSGADLLARFVGDTGLHKCGTYNNMAKLVITMFMDQQKDFLTYEAQGVVDYLRKEGIYEQDNTAITFTEYIPKTLTR